MDKNISNRQMYHEINSAIIKGLGNYSSKLESLVMENIQPNFADQYKKQLGAVCFAIPAKSEIKFDGKKLVGSAQKKMKSALLQHGSIICDDYHIRIVDYLNIPPGSISSYKSELSEKTTDLASILGEAIDYEILQECIERGFRSQFNAEFHLIESEEIASNFIIN
jgi:lipoate-protein ligase A